MEILTLKIENEKIAVKTPSYDFYWDSLYEKAKASNLPQLEDFRQMRIKILAQITETDEYEYPRRDEYDDDREIYGMEME